MTAEREALIRAVLDLPDEEVPIVLAEVRRHLRVVPAERPWPPKFFGSVTASRPDIATNHDDLLAEGFGRS